MIKLIFCIARAEGLSTHAFRRYWKEKHVPIGCHLAKKTGAIYFSRNTTLTLDMNSELNLLLGSSVPPYDGVGEVVWDDTTTIQGILENPALRHQIEEIKHSLLEFTDPNRSVIFFTEVDEVPLGESDSVFPDLESYKQKRTTT